MRHSLTLLFAIPLLLFLVAGNQLFGQRPVPRVDTSIVSKGVTSRKALLLFPNKKDSWVIGISGGAMFGNINMAGQNYSIKDKKTFQAGLIAGYGLSEDVRIQLELLFERRAFALQRFINGFMLSDTSEHICWECYYAYDVSYISDYLQLPLVFNYTRQRGSFSFGAEAGVYLALLLVNNQKGTEELYLDPVGADSFVSFGFEPGYSRVVYSGATANVINTYDTGLLLGLTGGYQLTSNFALTLNGRLQLGFTGVFENPQMPMLNFSSYTLRMGLSYQFNRQE